MKRRITKKSSKRKARAMATKKRRRPFFKVYDYIEFELNTKKDGPRWNLNVDEGSSGRWAKGIVIDIDLNFIEVEALMPTGIVKAFKFPNYASSDFDAEQWFFEGYLRKDEPNRIDKPKCECGYGDDSNLHFIFCPMHEHVMKKKDEEYNKNGSAFRP